MNTDINNAHGHRGEVPAGEPMISARQEILRGRSARHYLLSGPAVARLESTLALVARSLNFPIVRINILDEETQHTISIYGVGNTDAVSREVAFCDAVVRTGRPVEVDNAAVDPRFAQYPAVLDGEIGSYVGVPLRGRESLIVGAVCVIDPLARLIDEDDVSRLVEFSAIIEDQLDLIRRLKEQRQEGSVATTELARAIADGEIVPWYQQVVELGTGRLLGFEALARWVHPSGHVDDPRLFIPLAEDSDLIIELDLTVIRSALVDLKRWHRTHPDLHVSVNLSARHFSHPDCVATLQAITTEAGVDPASIVLELTETARLASSTGDVVQTVSDLRDFGFSVWLDDFGTGWSSLEHLLWLPVDGIKIDRALAVALSSPIGAALTKAVTGLANVLDLQTTIEGVDNDRTAELAIEYGCDSAQGFLWAEPVPAAAITWPEDPATETTTTENTATETIATETTAPLPAQNGAAALAAPGVPAGAFG